MLNLACATASVDAILLHAGEGKSDGESNESCNH